MEEEKKVKCIKCQKEFDETDGIKTKSGFVCNGCVAKRKKKNASIITGISLSAVAIGAICYFAPKNNTKGFDGVASIQDSTTITIEALVKPDFKIENAVAQNAPVTPGQTIDNIESFKRMMVQNMEDAQNANAGSINIPAISVFFDFESANISTAAKEVLNEYTKAYLQTNKVAAIMISGYTCNMGDDDINNSLSQQRAEAAKSILTASGIPANKIEVHGYGKSKNNDFSYSSVKEYRRVVVSIK